MPDARKTQRSTALRLHDRDNPGSAHNSIVAEVADWIAQKETGDALVERWQQLEHSLSLQAKASGVTFGKVLDGASRGARELRTLARQISIWDQKLQRRAQAILARPHASAADAVAKIQLAVRMQGQVDNDLPWELVRSGLRGLDPAGPL